MRHGWLPAPGQVRLLRTSGRVLDPVERACEILFGVIVTLTFTATISVSQGRVPENRTILVAAFACNVAWGLVDAAMYLMTSFAERARGLSMLRAIRQARRPEAADRMLLEALPGPLADVVTPVEIEQIRERLNQRPEPPARAALTRADFVGAAGVFLLVSLSTLPIVVPFALIADVGTAMRTSNAVALVILFAAGWALGRYAGRPGWRSGFGMVGVGLVLVVITIALGG